MDSPEPLRQHYANWSWSPLPSAAPDSQTTTWRLHDPSTGQVRYLKTASSCWYPRVLDEAARMRWAQAHLPVPQVLDSGTDQTVDWLVTAALPGRDATQEHLWTDPARLVALLARGLRRFHAAPAAARAFWTCDSVCFAGGIGCVRPYVAGRVACGGEPRNACFSFRLAGYG